MSNERVAGRGNRAVLEVNNVTITYETEMGPLDTVRNASLRIAPGEIYGLVGESGSGKTTLAMGIVRFLARNGRIKSGSICFDGIDLADVPISQMSKIWGARIAMVHQDPQSAVNPSITIGEQIAEVARIHLGMNKAQARAKSVEMLKKMGIPDAESVARRYGHQLSGGMLQRVVIAIALTTNPQLLIMDEPTTALDVTTEAVILDEVRELLKEYSTAVLYITHDLGVVARLCHRVGVMYAGEIVEEGTVQQVFKSMLHPYTCNLLGCVPRIDADKSTVVLNAIPGSIPRPNELPGGCIFSPRCNIAEERCSARRPLHHEGEPGHFSLCHRWEELRQDRGLCECTDLSREAKERVEGPVVCETFNLKKHFPAETGLTAFWRKGGASSVRAVEDVSIRVRKGFTMGVVGESGCGKTTLARCIAGLEKPNAGEIELEGKLLPHTTAKRSSAQKKKIQMVFQNPDASFNPLHPVGDSVGRPLVLLRNMPKKEIDSLVRELFRSVRLPEDYVYRLPHELSGGEKQRVAIARAYAADPTLMICDEPITSLDVSVQASLMNLLAELQESRGTAYLFISHDLAVVRHISDWIAVMYLGQLVELGSAENIFAPPYHPYTEALLSAIAIPDPDIEQERIRLYGNVPSAVNIPSGCRFHTRCPRRIGKICEEKEPAWQSIGHHQIRCHIPVDELRSMFKQVAVVKGAGAKEAK